MKYSLFFLLTVGLVLGQTRLIGHVTTPEGPFQTVIVLHNQSAYPKSVVITPFSQSGVSLQEVTQELEGGATSETPAEALFPGAGPSHLVITGPESVVVAAHYRPRNFTHSVETVLFEQHALGKGYLIQPGNKSDSAGLFWEGFAIVNPNHVANSVTITMMGPMGSQSNVLEIPAQGKISGVLGELFSGLFEDGIYFRFSGRRPFSLIGLGGSEDGQVLWPVQPLASGWQAAAPVLFSGTFPQEPYAEPFEFLFAGLEEDLLQLDLRYSGTCGYTLTLFMVGDFAESFPVRATLALVYDILPGQPCLRQVEEQREYFDLSPVAEAYRSAYGSEGEIILHINNESGEPLTELNYRPFQ